MKKEFNQELLIEGKTLCRLNKVLSLGEDEFKKAIDEHILKEDTTYYNKSVFFENNYSIDVKLCIGQNNPYLDIVLFDDNKTEIDSMVGEDTVDGEVCFETDEYEFNLLIKSA